MDGPELQAGAAASGESSFPSLEVLGDTEGQFLEQACFKQACFFTFLVSRAAEECDMFNT